METFLVTPQRVEEALREVHDPELGINVLDLGLVYDIAVHDSTVDVTMTLTSPGCPLHATLTAAVEEAVNLFVPGARTVRVHLVWDPPWSPERISPAGRAALGWT